MLSQSSNKFSHRLPMGEHDGTTMNLLTAELHTVADIPWAAVSRHRNLISDERMQANILSSSSKLLEVLTTCP